MPALSRANSFPGLQTAALLLCPHIVYERKYSGSFSSGGALVLSDLALVFNVSSSCKTYFQVRLYWDLGVFKEYKYQSITFFFFLETERHGFSFNFCPSNSVALGDIMP